MQIERIYRVLAASYRLSVSPLRYSRVHSPTLRWPESASTDRLDALDTLPFRHYLALWIVIAPNFLSMVGWRGKNSTTITMLKFSFASFFKYSHIRNEIGEFPYRFGMVIKATDYLHCLYWWIDS
jgi:hypothetical protein